MVGKIAYKPGDLVWVIRQDKKQLLKHCLWPGRIADPPSSEAGRMKRKDRWVYFFYHKSFSWVPISKIKPFSDEECNRISSKNKSYKYKRAVHAAKKYQKGLGESDSEDSCNSNELVIFPSNAKAAKMVHNSNLLPPKNKHIPPVSNEMEIIPPSDCESAQDVQPRDVQPRDVQPRDVQPQDVQPQDVQPQDVQPQDVQPQDVQPVKPFQEISHKRKIRHKRQGRYVDIRCKPPLLFEIDRGKNPYPEAAFVYVDPLHVLVQSAVQVNLCSREERAVNVKKIEEITCLKLSVPVYKFGVIGCGSVGVHVTAALLGLYQTVFIHDEDKSKCSSLEAHGAVYVRRAAEVFAKSDIVICCLPSVELVMKVLFSAPHHIYPKLLFSSVVVFTSMSSQSSLDIAEMLKRKNKRFLHASLFYPASHNSDSNSDILITVSGDADFYEEIKYHLHAISQRTIYVGDAGTASELSNILNTLMGTLVSILSEVLTLAKGMGIFDVQYPYEDFVSIIHSNPELENFFCTTTEDVQNILSDRWPLKMPHRQMQKAMVSTVALAGKVRVQVPIIHAAYEASGLKQLNSLEKEQ